MYQYQNQHNRENYLQYSTITVKFDCLMLFIPGNMDISLSQFQWAWTIPPSQPPPMAGFQWLHRKGQELVMLRLRAHADHFPANMSLQFPWFFGRGTGKLKSEPRARGRKKHTWNGPSSKMRTGIQTLDALFQNVLSTSTTVCFFCVLTKQLSASCLCFRCSWCFQKFWEWLYTAKRHTQAANIHSVEYKNIRCCDANDSKQSTTKYIVHLECSKMRVIGHNVVYLKILFPSIH